MGQKTDRDWYKDYERWVESQPLTTETKRTYLVHVRRYIRWKEGSIEGGNVASMWPGGRQPADSTAGQGGESGL